MVLQPTPFNPPLSWTPDIQHQLEMLGCVARLHGDNQIEIWEANLHEHYLVTALWLPEPKLDIVQLT